MTMTQDEHDEREDLYELLCKEVTTLCECGNRADAIVHALIRNAVELAVIAAGAENDYPAEARRMLTEAVRGTLLET